MDDLWKESDQFISDYPVILSTTAYAMNILTHVDFLIYDKLGKQPVLVVEVDGYAYHNQNKKQEQRDKLKDEILHKYNIPIARFKTNESNEKKRLTEMLSRVLCG
jgi:very-short-patch-repair endonuclease